MAAIMRLVILTSCLLMPMVDGKIKYKSCQHAHQNGHSEPGWFDIYPNATRPYKVWCEHSLNATGTLIQRRFGGTENFNRGYNDYKFGFGHPTTEYWIGLNNIYHLSNTGNSILYITLQDFNGDTRYAQYNHFVLGPESTGFKLNIYGFSGNVPDDMSFQNGMPFATQDKPDIHKCAINMRAGWWYNYCAYAMLNGLYYHTGRYKPSGGFYDGIYWKDWLGYDYSLRFTSMVLYHV